MTDPHPNSLLYPFNAGAVIAPQTGGRLLCIGSTEPLPNEGRPKVETIYIQGFRPHYLALDRAGCTVEPTLPSAQIAAAMIRLGRHRGQNENWLADAVRLVAVGGPVVVAGGKTDGVSSLRKRVGKTLPGCNHKAMNHGEVFWFTVDDDSLRALANLRAADAKQISGRFFTAPGMFSHGRIDPGSELLAGHISPALKGEVADLGAGWGYLAASVLDNCPAVERVDLYEADHAALEAARRNLLSFGDGRTRFFWQDLRTEEIRTRYDAVVMNPPFHQGRAAEPDIGREIIATAAKALRPGGELWVVANKKLPYEAVLSNTFARVSRIAEAEGYKVLCAKR